MALLVILSGCLGGSTPKVIDDSASIVETGVSLAIEGESCFMAGAVSLNPWLLGSAAAGVFPEPFAPADTSGYTGAPATGTAIGVWHAPFECEGWAVNGEHSHSTATGGIVAALVEAPPFEEVEAVDHNFLVATLASRNDAVVEFFKDNGWYVYPGMGTLGMQKEPGTWFTRAVLSTAGDGVYESFLSLESKGASWPTLRFWLIVEGEDDRLHPARLDFLLTGGATHIGPSVFTHTGAGDHVGGVTGAPMGGLGFRDFAFTIEFEILEATMEEMWDH